MRTTSRAGARHDTFLLGALAQLRLVKYTGWVSFKQFRDLLESVGIVDHLFLRSFVLLPQPAEKGGGLT